MKDDLEKYVRTHKSEFDSLEPTDQLWQGIANELDRSKPTADGTFWWKVAAAFFLLSTIALLVLDNYPLTNKQLATEQATVSTELAEVESYYTRLIAERRKALANHPLANEELLEELDRLDALYEELRNTLDVNQGDERLIHAMIRNLQLRVEILNKQLKILENIKTKETDESITM